MTLMRLSTDSREALFQAAIQARQHAHFPHSHFRVGAAVLCADGAIFKGASVDNAAYGASTCAERSAIVNAVSEGKHAFVALAVVSDVVTPISPCGLCLQVIAEFCGADVPVWLLPGDYRGGEGGERVIEVSVGALLPGVRKVKGGWVER